MYAAAQINDFYKPSMKVAKGEATISIEASDKHHHSAGAVHGSVYFKMLDDVAFFADNSLGKVVNKNSSQIIIVNLFCMIKITKKLGEGMVFL